MLRKCLHTWQKTGEEEEEVGEEGERNPFCSHSEVGRGGRRGCRQSQMGSGLLTAEGGRGSTQKSTLYSAFGAPPRNAPLWHVYYFGLATIKAQKSQEELFTSRLTTSNNLNRGLGPGRELPAEISTETVRGVWGAEGSWQSLLFTVLPAAHCLPRGMTNICLPNICSSQLPANCPSFSLRPPATFCLARGGIQASAACVWASHVFVGLLYPCDSICLFPV